MQIKRLTFLQEYFYFRPAINPDGTHIAFSTYIDLYLGRVDEGRFTKLSSDGPYLRPSFSPDGTRIVCMDGSGYYEGDNLYDISILDVNTGSKQRITNTGNEVEPIFSRDGNTIIFIARDAKEYSISTVRCDASDIIQLARARRLKSGRSIYEDLAVTADGEWIFYLFKYEVYRIKANGRGQQRLTFTDRSVGYFLISPDGTQVAFATTNEDRVPGRPVIDIWLMNVDGTDQRLLEEGTSVSFMGSFSPDGKWLAVSSSRDRVSLGGGRLSWRIFLINTESGEVRRLTEGGPTDKNPQFTPDGEKIIFMSDRDGREELYLLTDFF